MTDAIVLKESQGETVPPSTLSTGNDRGYYESLSVDPKRGCTVDDITGLILPSQYHLKEESCARKVAPSIGEAQKIIRSIRNNRVTIMNPGSFDAAHIGHLTFLTHQVPDAVTPKLKSKPFSVVLADADPIIADAKRSKFKDEGGDEPQRRPVETIEERAAILSLFPSVNLVTMIPDQTQPNLPTIPQLNPEDMLAQLDIKAFTEKYTQILNTLDLPSERKQELLDRLEKDRKELIKGIKDYSEMIKDSTEGIPPQYKSLQSWQLYILGSLVGANANSRNQRAPKYEAGSILRIVSHDDVKYLTQVIFLMDQIGIDVDIIKDYNLGSTSGLIKTAIKEDSSNPWGWIKEKKRLAMEKIGVSDFYKNLVRNISRKLHNNKFDLP